jgi:hypothetical protein
MRDLPGITETLHLMRSPRNAARLMQAIADADAGRMIEFDPRSPRAVGFRARSAKRRAVVRKGTRRRRRH